MYTLIHITIDLEVKSVISEKQFRLEGAEDTAMGNQTGRVSVQQYGIWGRVCPNSWDDSDATVVCKGLGFAGGVAYKYTSSGRVSNSMMSFKQQNFRLVKMKSINRCKSNVCHVMFLVYNTVKNIVGKGENAGS